MNLESTISFIASELSGDTKLAVFSKNSMDVTVDFQTAPTVEIHAVFAKLNATLDPHGIVVLPYMVQDTQSLIVVSTAVDAEHLSSVLGAMAPPDVYSHLNLFGAASLDAILKTVNKTL